MANREQILADFETIDVTPIHPPQVEETDSRSRLTFFSSDATRHFVEVNESELDKVNDLLTQMKTRKATAN